ncbi:uncharacterized protein EV420DRAFT_1481728 [Desarmillaria tabescens]|uniref:Uncharacterized protein n=1 Tax=Armillaria tabescens TaxID=1929756 RepID=A0AA39N0T1_ARMTA|nr:uncharacterized protein EV420DRAFT_1481728 [Desarmillaria tabescens]KAK0454006.1 hypothetical protein EV420DRAFT_1481728 [Desarmillaria tabescens]
MTVQLVLVSIRLTKAGVPPKTFTGTQVSRMCQRSNNRNSHQKFPALFLLILEQDLIRAHAMTEQARIDLQWFIKSLKRYAANEQGHYIPPDLTDADKALMFLFLDAALNSTILYMLLHGIYTGILAVTLWNIFINKCWPMRRALVIVIILLYTLITINIATTWSFLCSGFIENTQSFWTVFSKLSGAVNQAAYLEIGIAASLSTILADSYIIWCCWMVWGWCWLIVLLPILCLISATVSRIIEIYHEYFPSDTVFLTLYMTFILAMTLWCTLLIIFRILTVTGVRYGAGSRLRVYHRFIGVLVESSALYSIALILDLAFYIHNDYGSYYPDTIAAIMKGVAPTLLVGRAAAGHTQPTEEYDESSTVSTLRFQMASQSSQPSQPSMTSFQESTRQSPVLEMDIEAQRERSDELMQVSKSDSKPLTVLRSVVIPTCLPCPAFHPAIWGLKSLQGPPLRTRNNDRNIFRWDKKGGVADSSFPWRITSDHNISSFQPNWKVGVALNGSVSSTTGVYYPGPTSQTTSTTPHQARNPPNAPSNPGETKTPSQVNSNQSLQIKGNGRATNQGFSSTSGVQIAMTRFYEVTYDTATQTAVIGAGSIWDDIYAVLDAQGYLYLRNQYGLSIDNVVAYELVAPNGTVVTVKEETDMELFFSGQRQQLRHRHSVYLKDVPAGYHLGTPTLGVSVETTDWLLQGSIFVKFCSEATNPKPAVSLPIIYIKSMSSGQDYYRFTNLTRTVYNDIPTLEYSKSVIQRIINGLTSWDPALPNQLCPRKLPPQHPRTHSRRLFHICRLARPRRLLYLEWVKEEEDGVFRDTARKLGAVREKWIQKVEEMRTVLLSRERQGSA